MLTRSRILSDWLMGCFSEGDEGAGSPPPNPDPPAGDPPKDPPKSYDEEYVKKLRAEAAENRKKASDYEKRLKEIDDANLTEAEKLKKRAEDAEAKATASQSRIAKAEFKAAAAGAKFINPDAAYKLIADQIEFDEAGEPKNIAALVEKLAKDEPYLIQQGQGGGGSPANPAGGRGGQPGQKVDPKNLPGWGSILKR